MFFLLWANKKSAVKLLCLFCTVFVSVMVVMGTETVYAEGESSSSESTEQTEEPGRITLTDANVSFVPIDGWLGVSRSGMEQSVLDAIPILKSTMNSDFEKNNGYYYSVDTTRMHELYVSSSSDERSEKIFSSVDGDYTLITDYLNNPSKYLYMSKKNRTYVSKATEKNAVDNAVFYVVEYSSDYGKGICYSAVVNGKYISFDFRCKTGDFTDIDKINFTNLMKSVKILQVEERPKLDRTQITIIGGVGFLLLILILGIAAVNSKKKRS